MIRVNRWAFSVTRSAFSVQPVFLTKEDKIDLIDRMDITKNDLVYRIDVTKNDLIDRINITKNDFIDRINNVETRFTIWIISAFLLNYFMLMATKKFF